MTLTVVVTVIVLAFVVSGYWLNSDFEIERQGMLQVYSTPTGADVIIDGDTSWFQKTNTSKVLSSGEHSVTISKEGYDSWSRDIEISEGLLYRLHYPRLFLLERTKEKLLDTTGTSYATVSPSRDTMLLITGQEWRIINLDDSNLSPKTITLPESLLSSTLSADGEVQEFQVLSAEWSRDNSKVLMSINENNTKEWVLIDINNLDKDINLTRSFNADFSSVRILDNSASTLLAIRNGNLHKIDLGSKATISEIIVESIDSFDYYDNNIVFSAQSSESESAHFVGVTKTNGDNTTTIVETEEPSKIANLKFYDSNFIVVLSGNQLTLYQKDSFEKDSEYTLSFAPDNLKVGYHGDYIVMYTGNKIAALDMEAKEIIEWAADGESFGWIDSSIVYSITDGNLYVYDFNGLNRRLITENVSNRFPVTITNEKWLYYFSDNYLVREVIAK